MNKRWLPYVNSVSSTVFAESIVKNRFAKGATEREKFYGMPNYMLKLNDKHRKAIRKVVKEIWKMPYYQNLSIKDRKSQMEQVIRKSDLNRYPEGLEYAVKCLQEI